MERRGEANTLVGEAQEGNWAARDRLIRDHQSFIKQIVAKNVFGYEAIDSRDEYSIGLLAFNEAIDSYKPGLRSFRSFAAGVIKRRLIDYHRSELRYRGQTLSIEDAAGLPGSRAQDRVEETVQIRLEMESLVANLARYGIDLQDLIRETPKHLDSRRLCVELALAVTGDPSLREHFQRYGSLPLKLLLQKVGVNAKTVERHRKYIIAICLVLLSDLEVMKGYVEQLGEGVRRNG